RTDSAVVPVAGADGVFAVHGGGEVAIQVAPVTRPVDAQRERLLVQRVDGEPVVSAATVTGAADRVLREHGVEAAERRERGIGGGAQVEERGIGRELDRERDRRHCEPDGRADGATAARAWVADDVHGASGVRIVLRLAVADLDVARSADGASAGVPAHPRLPSGRAAMAGAPAIAMQTGAPPPALLAAMKCAQLASVAPGALRQFPKPFGSKLEHVASTATGLQGAPSHASRSKVASPWVGVARLQ